MPIWKEKFYFEPKLAICTPTPTPTPLSQMSIFHYSASSVINLACSQKNQSHYSKWIYYLIQVGVYYLRQRDASLQSHYTFKEKPQLGWSDPWPRRVCFMTCYQTFSCCSRKGAKLHAHWKNGDKRQNFHAQIFFSHPLPLHQLWKDWG